MELKKDALNDLKSKQKLLETEILIINSQVKRLSKEYEELTKSIQVNFLILIKLIQRQIDKSKEIKIKIDLIKENLKNEYKNSENLKEITQKNDQEKVFFDFLKTDLWARH